MQFKYFDETQFNRKCIFGYLEFWTCWWKNHLLLNCKIPFNTTIFQRNLTIVIVKFEHFHEAQHGRIYNIWGHWIYELIMLYDLQFNF